MATHANFLSAAGIAAPVVWHRLAPAIELTTGTLLRPERELADFSLIDQQGRVFASADRGRRVDAKRDTPAQFAKYVP